MADALARFDTARAGDHTVLTVDGELDLSNVDALDRHIENAGRRGGLALDLSGVAYLDSSALRTISGHGTFASCWWRRRTRPPTG